MAELRKAYLEQRKQKAITTRNGNTTIVHPVMAVTVGQAVVVVAEGKIYTMAGLWSKMTPEEVRGANEGAFAGKQWIEEHPAADTKGNDMRGLRGGTTFCEHTGFPQHRVDCITNGKALIFGRVKPEEQMADSITVGTVRSTLPKSEVCTRWRIHKGVVPQFRRDGTIYQIDQRSNGEVPDDTIPQQLSGSIAQSTASSLAPTPRSFTACPSEYDFDPMDYTNLEELEDLECEQDAGAQLKGEADEGGDEAASEQLQRYQRRWESATPQGSPTPSRRGAETVFEEPIVYEEGRSRKEVMVAEWVSQLREDSDTGSDSSTSTITKSQDGIDPERGGGHGEEGGLGSNQGRVSTTGVERVVCGGTRARGNKSRHGKNGTESCVYGRTGT